MEQETELNIHKKERTSPLYSMDVDNSSNFSHKSVWLSTKKIYVADAMMNIN